MTTRPERFGLTMVEAMACGTPVLGSRLGSNVEIVDDGVTGFLCDSTLEAVTRVPDLAKLSRRACRERVEALFTVDRMVDRYCGYYEEVLRRRTPSPATPELIAARNHDWWDRPQAFTDIPPKPRAQCY
jgi:glycosyltransferase involved in cell wall biosynthesis